MNIIKEDDFTWTGNSKIGGFARAIAEYSVKTSQSNKVEGYKYLSSEVPDRAIMRLIYNGRSKNC